MLQGMCTSIYNMNSSHLNAMQFLLQSDLITSSSLAVVVSLVTENPEPNLSYETIQIRRECAKILITLAQFNAAGVVESISRLHGATFLPHWFDQVQHLEDVRLRSHSEKAINILNKISG